MLIKRERILLRDVTKSDLRRIMHWRNKERIRKNFFTQKRLTLKGQFCWYNSYLKHKKTDKVFIIEALRKKPIGTVSLYNIEYKTKTAEFGRMMIGEDAYLRKEYGLEATKAILQYGFIRIKLNHIYLKVFTSNKKAIELYKKAGFKIENILKKEILVGKKRKDITVMGIFRKEFRKRK